MNAQIKRAVEDVMLDAGFPCNYMHGCGVDFAAQDLFWDHNPSIFVCLDCHSENDGDVEFIPNTPSLKEALCGTP